jgi:Na+/H+-dicarboxylate symporter
MCYLKNTNIQLLISLILAYTLQPFLSVNAIAFFYSLSLALKDMLMIVLPFLIFFYVAAALTSFKKAAPLMVLSLLVLVILSNALTVLTAYGIGTLTLHGLCGKTIIKLSNNSVPLPILFKWPLPQIIKNEWALIAGIVIGIGCSLLSINKRASVIAFIQKGKDKATLILKKGFIPILPLYVLGFGMKLIHNGSLETLLENYSKVFLLSSVLIVSYIVVMYLIGTGFSIQKTLTTIKTMFPAWLTGFSTMSSAVAMPMTLAATEKNIEDSAYAQFVVPTTANIHMVGDGLSIALTALALLVMSGCGLPSFDVYLIFVMYYCLAKFSSAGVPGGGVIVILPVVERYLGLNADLTSLLATIYILQDSLMTSSNVMANGAFAMITHKIFKKIGWQA